jgi:hypothetical protein
MVKKMDKVDGTDLDKSEWINLEFIMDPDNSDLDSKYSQQFSIFKDARPEEWIKWVMAFPEIENLMPMRGPAEKTKMFRHLRRRLEPEDSELCDNEVIELVLRELYIG